jgi:hypothetical protein
MRLPGEEIVRHFEETMAPPMRTATPDIRSNERLMARSRQFGPNAVQLEA